MNHRRTSEQHWAALWLWLAVLQLFASTPLHAIGLAHAGSAGTEDISVATPAVHGLYLYTGEQIDPDLGMYYLRARYYQPGIGRFWNMDSYEGRQGEPLSLHKYLYCHGDPINYSDPSGNFENLSGAITSIAISMATRMPTLAPVLYAGQRAANNVNAAGLANWFRVVLNTAARARGKIPSCDTGVQFERALNPVMRMLGGRKGEMFEHLLNGTQRRAFPDWVFSFLGRQHILAAKLGQAIEVTGQQFRIFLMEAQQTGASINYITLGKPQESVMGAAEAAAAAANVTIRFFWIMP